MQSAWERWGKDEEFLNVLFYHRLTHLLVENHYKS